MGDDRQSQPPRPAPETPPCGPPPKEEASPRDERVSRQHLSPSWYIEDERVAPTWNFSVAHCSGVPEILDPEENLRVLTRLVDHFEQR